MNISSSDLHPKLLEDFFEECDEHLNSIREGLVRIEAATGINEFPTKAIEALFQTFHSFKGISGIVGLHAAESLAHATEEVLRRLNKQELHLSPAVLDILMASAQKLEAIVNAFRSHRPVQDEQGLIRELCRLCSSAASQDAPVIAASPSTPLAQSVDEALARGSTLWRFTFVPSRELDNRGINSKSVRTRLLAMGEILQATPNVLSQGGIAFEFLVAVRESPTDIAQWEADGISPRLADPMAPALLSLSLPHTTASTESNASPFIAPSPIVRVDLKRLDDLMRISGELVIQRSRLEQHLGHAASRPEALELSTLNEIHLALARAIRELRESIMRARLVPVAEIFARMPFVIRDLSRETNKRVRLAIEGQETEIDKYTVERLKDPLLHLVRNAFAHGIESTEERAACSKPSEGAVCLRATTIGDIVVIQVRDDGRGIDRTEVARKAAAQGLKLPPVMDDVALLDILCSPGFSTKAEADLSSGRGVGMSVVSSAVRELGGSITVETEQGKGTQFTLRLPLTLVIADTFIVSAAGQTCAIPQGAVLEVLQTPESEISVVNLLEVIPFRGGILPIVRLASFFKLKDTSPSQGSVLVLSSDRGSVGLIVERIHGQREVVVHALRDPLVQVHGISGVTELGDGKPVLILDATVLTSGAVRPHPRPALARARVEEEPQ